MDKIVITELKGFDAVRTVVDGIVRLFEPDAVYLYKHKLNANGEFTDFKLCVIAGLADKNKAECEIYNRIDSDIPFDVLLYTLREWEEISADEASFAGKIIRTGTVLYTAPSK